MARLILSILIGVTLTVTVACGDSDKKATFHKVLGGGGQDFGVQVGTIMEKSGREGCLRLDELVRALQTIGDNGLVAYNSDVALGRSENGTIDLFEMTEDRKLQQDVLLRGRDAELAVDVINKPTAARLSGNLLKTGFIGRFLNGTHTLDAECKTMKLQRSNSAAPVEHKVIKKSGTSLVVQNTITNEVIQYTYQKEASRLEIVSLRASSPDMKVCDKSLPPLIKSSYILARQSQASPFVISYDFATLIAGFVKNTTDLREILSETEKGRPISVEARAFAAILESIQGDEFTRAECN